MKRISILMIVTVLTLSCTGSGTEEEQKGQGKGIEVGNPLKNGSQLKINGKYLLKVVDDEKGELEVSELDRSQKPVKKSKGQLRFDKSAKVYTIRVDLEGVELKVSFQLAAQGEKVVAKILRLEVGGAVIDVTEAGADLFPKPSPSGEATNVAPGNSNADAPSVSGGAGSPSASPAGSPSEAPRPVLGGSGSIGPAESIFPWNPLVEIRKITILFPKDSIFLSPIVISDGGAVEYALLAFTVKAAAGPDTEERYFPKTHLDEKSQTFRIDYRFPMESRLSLQRFEITGRVDPTSKRLVSLGVREEKAGQLVPVTGLTFYTETDPAIRSVQ